MSGENLRKKGSSMEDSEAKVAKLKEDMLNI